MKELVFLKAAPHNGPLAWPLYSLCFDYRTYTMNYTIDLVDNDFQKNWIRLQVHVLGRYGREHRPTILLHPYLANLDTIGYSVPCTQEINNIQRDFKYSYSHLQSLIELSLKL